MATCVFYIDEAGDTDKHLLPITPTPTPLFTLAALAFPLSEWRARDRAYLALKKDFFPDLLAQTIKRPEEWEAKGSDLTKPHNAQSTRRHAFIARMLTFVAQNSGNCFSVTFLKNSKKPTPARSMYTQALQILVERFSIFVAEHPVYSEGLLICDSRLKGMNGNDIDVARSHMSYIFGNETGKQFINIVEAPLFADSRLTVGLQVVDIIASLIYANHYYYYLRRTEGALNYNHVQSYWPYLDKLQFKSRNPVDGHQMFGYRILDHREEKKQEIPFQT